MIHHSRYESAHLAFTEIERGKTGRRARVRDTLLTRTRDVGAATEVDEADLVARAQLDRRAFAPLYARYADPVYRYCYRRLGHHDAAADATSLVFAKALAALPRYHAGSFRSWLFAIAHNTVVDGLRGSRGDVQLDDAVERIDPAPTPEELSLAADDARELRDALTRLTADQRHVVELRLAGLTDQEIAEVLGRSLAATRMLQVRAVARLRLVLGGSRAQGDAHG
jgi:RNA polymerase sigma-70 factor (ECF subfamily)